jgi:hypothetical protein
MPKLTDDGSTVTLDLHGARVGEGVAMAQRTLRLAAQRGRSAVKLVHGRSTSSRAFQNRTLKHELERIDRENAWSAPVTSSLSQGGALLLGLPIGGRPDPARITLLDVA